jgi:hypothetical protein
MICSQMSAAPAPAETDPDSPAPWERALLDRQLERLDELADMGMALAREIQRRATTAAPDADITHAAIDFARVSRAVRMTLALQSKLVRDFKTPIKAGPAGADNDDGAKDFALYWDDGEPMNPAAERAVLRETVRDLAEDRGLDREAMERLEVEAIEQYERDDLYPRYPAPGNVRFHQMVGLICEALGLKPTDPDLPRAAAGGGPLADPGFEPGEERVGVGAGQAHGATTWFDGDSS